MDDATQEPTPEREYEAPRAEDVETGDTPSITAAGKTGTGGAGA